MEILSCSGKYNPLKWKACGEFDRCKTSLSYGNNYQPLLEDQLFTTLSAFQCSAGESPHTSCVVYQIGIPVDIFGGSKRIFMYIVWVGFLTNKNLFVMSE